MTVLPFHAIPVIVADQVRLRIYRGGDLELELPLRRRQALVLAAQILNLAPMPAPAPHTAEPAGPADPPF